MPVCPWLSGRTIRWNRSRPFAVCMPEDKLQIGEVLFAYTQGSAYAEFSDLYKGRLAPGYVADFVVLDRDLTAIPAAEILKTRVLRTVVDGRVVYEGSKN